MNASGHARARGLVTTRRVLVAGVAGVMLLGASTQAGAASRPVSDPRIVAHLDFSRGQTPENVALEPDGSADITLAVAAQVAQVSRSGEVRILAQLPRPAGGAACPVLGSLLGATALTVGIARDHGGSLYVALCTGSPDLQGIWRIGRSGSMARVAALPPFVPTMGAALEVEQLTASGRPGEPVRPCPGRGSGPGCRCLRPLGYSWRSCYPTLRAWPGEPAADQRQVHPEIHRFRVRISCPRIAAADAQCFWLTAPTSLT